jgi:hypothetical protein
MNKKLLVAFAGLIAVVGLVSFSNRQQLGGDFPQGMQPSQLLTASSGASSVSPVSGLPNFLVPGAISAGGVAAGNQLTVVYTATTSYPSAAANLGPIQAATSTTSTVVSFVASGFSVGDPCEVSYNGATTTGAFGADSFVTAVNGNAVSATVTFWNGAGSLITLTPTSSATGVSSTLKTTCFHTGV